MSYLEGTVPSRNPGGEVISSISQLSPSVLGEIRNWLENDPGRWQVQGTQLTGQLSGTIDYGQVQNTPPATVDNFLSANRNSGQVDTTSTSYQSLGPSLANLTGHYLILYGCNARTTNPGSDRAFISVSVGLGASDADSASSGDDHFNGIMCCKNADGLSNATATVHYRSGSGAQAFFDGRWIMALKVA